MNPSTSVIQTGYRELDGLSVFTKTGKCDGYTMSVRHEYGGVLRHKPLEPVRRVERASQIRQYGACQLGVEAEDEDALQTQKDDWQRFRGLGIVKKKGWVGWCLVVALMLGAKL